MTTILHFELLINVLADITEKHKNTLVKVISDKKYNNKRLKTKSVIWSSINEVFDLSEIDIGLMPLPDDKWSKGKCACKGLQFMAMQCWWTEIGHMLWCATFGWNHICPPLVYCPPPCFIFLAMAEKKGFDIVKLRGTAQNDILKEMIGRGTWVYPVEPSIKLVADTIEYCARHAPNYSPVSVCGYHIRESGCDPAEEMGYAFAIAKAYIDETLKRDLDIDEFAGRLSFNFNIFGNLFEQVAKFRAGRRLWATILKEEYGAKDPKTMWMRMIAGGGGFGLTIEQPENNIVRGAYYALIAALSGAQTVALCCYDEAYTIPSEKAQRISLRTMQILIEEMGLCDTVDPLGGSYYIESLTDEMESKIREAMARVDAEGGIVNAVAEGRVQDRVSRHAYDRELALENGEMRKVGVNCYRINEEDPDVEFHPTKPEDLNMQIESLSAIKDERDQRAVDKTLANLEQDARKGVNIMPAIMEAVQVYATVGEMTDALTGVYGQFIEPIRF